MPRRGRLADSSAGWPQPAVAPLVHPAALRRARVLHVCGAGAYVHWARRLRPLASSPPIRSLWRPGTVLAARLAREAVHGRPTEGRRTQTFPDTGREEGMRSDTLQNEAEAVARIERAGARALADHELRRLL